jgi:hypothetical protein
VQRRIGDASLDFDVAARRSDLMNRIVDQKHHIRATQMVEINEFRVVDKNLKMFHLTNTCTRSSAVCADSSLSNSTHASIAVDNRLGGHVGAQV